MFISDMTKLKFQYSAESLLDGHGTSSLWFRSSFLSIKYTCLLATLPPTAFSKTIPTAFITASFCYPRINERIRM